MKTDNFIDVLLSDDREKISTFLSDNGKIKPYSPIYFYHKDQINKEGENDNGREESGE